jgi:hypothetical protein
MAARQRRRRPGLQGLLEDELCPDEIEGWTIQNGSSPVCPHFGNNRIKGLTSGAGGDTVADDNGKNDMTPQDIRQSMSFDIFRFLDEIVKKQLPDLAKKNTYFGAGLIAVGIEFLGACLDDCPLDAEYKSASRFCLAVNELFPKPYHQFSRPHPYKDKDKPAHDLYSCLRCGMTHVLRPQGVVLTGSVNEASLDGNTHLQILSRGVKDSPLIVVEQFVADFVVAATELQSRLRGAALPEKLAGDILTVWPS